MKSAAKRQEFVYVVEAYDGKRFRKVRGPEGGPWLNRSRALKIAQGLEAEKGNTHRVETRKKGPMLDPLAMPPEESEKLRAEGYGHLIAKPTSYARMDDVPGYRRDW